MKLIMLINARMPTIVGILTFVSMINTTSENLKVRSLYCSALKFSLAVEISCSIELSMKKVL